MNDQHDLYESARRRIKQKKGLFIHFTLFVLGSLFFVVANKWLHYGENYAINWHVGASVLWFFIFLFHAVKIYILNPFFGKEWERKQTEKILKKHNSKFNELEKKVHKKLKSIKPNNVLKKEESPSQNPTIIAAISSNYALGKDNQLIWHLPADLKRFKKVTAGHHVVMGRKTFESLGKPLPNRTNIVISRNPSFKAEGCLLVDSLEKALNLSKADPKPYILGGAEIYNQAIKIVDEMDLTIVHHEFEADAFFPEIDNQIWKVVSREDFKADEKNKYDFSFVTYVRRKTIE